MNRATGRQGTRCTATGGIQAGGPAWSRMGALAGMGTVSGEPSPRCWVLGWDSDQDELLLSGTVCLRTRTEEGSKQVFVVGSQGAAIGPGREVMEAFRCKSVQEASRRRDSGAETQGSEGLGCTGVRCQGRTSPSVAPALPDGPWMPPSLRACWCLSLQAVAGPSVKIGANATLAGALCALLCLPASWEAIPGWSLAAHGVL